MSLFKHIRHQCPSKLLKMRSCKARSKLDASSVYGGRPENHRPRHEESRPARLISTAKESRIYRPLARISTFTSVGRRRMS